MRNICQRTRGREMLVGAAELLVLPRECLAELGAQRRRGVPQQTHIGASSYSGARAR
jgi:hypothetical protein